MLQVLQKVSSACIVKGKTNLGKTGASNWMQTLANARGILAFLTHYEAPKKTVACKKTVMRIMPVVRVCTSY